jgi:hypothetical protein
MKLFTFATSSVFLGCIIIATTAPAAVIAQADDVVVNGVGVIAALRGRGSSGIIEKTRPPAYLWQWKVCLKKRLFFHPGRYYMTFQ